MRAAVIHGYGGPEQVRVADVPRPVVQAPHEVVVGVRAAALNRLDLFVLGGLPGITHSFPHVLGADGAGIVEAVGPAVTRVRPGDRVVLNPGLSCGACEWCRKGEHSLCVTYGLLGEHHPGTIAEAVRVPETSLEPLPPGVSWTDAAAYPLVTLTAWRMLTTRAQLQRGETVLIWGIGGGVALAALGIAKLLGARTIVTSSSAAKLERARALGADETIDHARTDVAKEVRRFTDRRGCDVVVDSVGERTWETSVRCLARAGRLVTCGGTTGPMVTTDVRKLFWYHYSLLGSTMGNWSEFREIAQLLGRGSLRPVVDSVVPLSEAGAAFARLARGEQFGKLVIEVDG
jgi:NADPH:quinone reductase-like Zn-dependent oxidoreductase